MKILIASVIAALLLTSAAQSQQRTFKDFIKEPAFAVKAAGDSFDFTTSMRFDGVHVREANPLWARRDGTFAWPRNLAFTAALTFVEYEVYRRNRKLGVVLLIANGAIRSWAGAHNLRLIRGAGR